MNRSQLLLVAFVYVVTFAGPWPDGALASEKHDCPCEVATMVPRYGWPAYWDLHNSSDIEGRIRAASRLVAVGFSDQEVMETVMEALDDADPRNKAIACGTLKRLGPRAAEAVPALIRLLGQAHVQANAAGALAEMGPVAEEALPRLRELTSGPNAVVALHARAAIVRISGSAGSHVAALTQALAEDRPLQERIVAACLLGDIGPLGSPAVPALLELLNETGYVKKWMAADALGQIGARPATVIPALKSVYLSTEGDETEDLIVRGVAITSLGNFPEHRSDIVSFLLPIVEGGRVREAVEALRTLERLDAYSPEVYDALERALGRDDGLQDEIFGFVAAGARPPVRFLEDARKAVMKGDQDHVCEKGIRYLARLAQNEQICQPAVSALIIGTRHPREYTRLAAAKALGESYPCMQDQVVQALTDSLDDIDYAVVRAAVLSLGKLGRSASAAREPLRLLKERYNKGHYNTRKYFKWHRWSQLFPLDELINWALEAIGEAGNGP